MEELVREWEKVEKRDVEKPKIGRGELAWWDARILDEQWHDGEYGDLDFFRSHDVQPLGNGQQLRVSCFAAVDWTRTQAFLWSFHERV